MASAASMLEFSSRMDLPGYKITYDNNVLAITFDEPVGMAMPDMASTMPQYLTIGRVDPDGKGVRFGLRNAVTIHSMEAGEKLFVDLLPTGWQGLPPSLPPEIVADLAKRAKDAEILAEQKRKAEEAKALNPVATLQVGRNPTFYRVEVDWSTATKATYKQDGNTATLNFDWPVPVDLYNLKSSLPAEISGAANSVTAAGSSIIFTLADGVTPRFYAVDPQHFTFDIDLTSAEVDKNRTTAEAAAKKADADAAAAAAAKVASGSGTSPDNARGGAGRRSAGRCHHADRRPRVWYGADDFPVRPRYGVGGVPARRYALDAVRHADPDQPAAADRCPVVDRFGLHRGQRRRNADRAGRFVDAEACDAGIGGALLGAVDRRRVAECDRAGGDQPQPRPRRAFPDVGSPRQAVQGA